MSMNLAPQNMVSTIHDPRFSILQDDKENVLASQSRLGLSAQDAWLMPTAPKCSNTAKKVSFGRTMSTPSLRSPEKPPLPQVARSKKSQKSTLIDPFLDSDSTQPSVHIQDLSRTLSSLQMMMNHTAVRLDAMSAKQQSLTEGLEKLQALVGTSGKASQSYAVSGGDDRGSCSVPDDQIELEDTQMQNGQHKKLPTNSYRTALRHSTRRSTDLQKSMITLKSEVDVTRPDQRKTVQSNRRNRDSLQVDTNLVNFKDDHTANHSEYQYNTGPVTERVDRMQTSIDSHYQTTETLSATSKHLVVSSRDQRSSPDRIEEDLDTLKQRLEPLQTTIGQGADIGQRFRDDIDARMNDIQIGVERNKNYMQQIGEEVRTRLPSRIDASLKRMQSSHAMQQRVMTSMCSKMMDMMQTQQRQIDELIQNTHHVVIPPPRKMNRKLVGYVYERE